MANKRRKFLEEINRKINRLDRAGIDTKMILDIISDKHFPNVKTNEGRVSISPENLKAYTEDEWKDIQFGLEESVPPLSQALDFITEEIKRKAFEKWLNENYYCCEGEYYPLDDNLPFNPYGAWCERVLYKDECPELAQQCETWLDLG